MLVAYCGAHRRAFTVYPPGHVPYGRQAVAPADSRGQVLRQGGGEAAHGRPMWEKTIFVAAVEASAGQQWSDSSLGQDQWRRRTQGRWLELGARLLGLTEVTERVQERLSEQLGLDCLEIREGPTKPALQLGLTPIPESRPVALAPARGGWGQALVSD